MFLRPSFFANRKFITPIGPNPLVALTLSANSLAENTPAGTVIGAIIGLTSGSIFSILPSDTRVSIVGTNLVVGLTAASPGSFNITIREIIGPHTRNTTLSLTVASAGSGTSTFSNPQISPNGEYITFTTSGGTWAGKIVVNPLLMTINCTTPSSDAVGVSNILAITRRVGYRASYAANVMTVWLSQPIYSSTTGITVTMATGAVSVGSDSNNALSNVAVTNNSTRPITIPKGHIIGIVEGRTTLKVRRDVIQSAFHVEAFGTHEGGIRVVKFDITDGTTTITRYATEETRSIYQDTAIIDNSQWSANSNGGIGVYTSGSVDYSAFIEGEITITATFIPKIGGPTVARTISWVLACNSAGGYIERVRYCDNVSGNDAWDGTTAAFVSGTTGPKLTLQAAVLSAGSVNGGATSAKTVPIVKLVGGTSESPRTYLIYQGTGSGNAIPSHTHTWLTFQPAEGHDATTVRFANHSGTLSGVGSRIRRIKLKNLTHDISNAADSTGTSSAVLASINNSVYPIVSNPESLCWESCIITHRLGKNGQISEGSSGYYYSSSATDNNKLLFINCSFTDMNQRGPFATANIFGRNNTLIDVCKDTLKEPECWITAIMANNRVAPKLLPVSNLSGGTPQPGDNIYGLYSGYNATVSSYVPSSPLGTVILESGFDAFLFKRDDSLTHNAVTISNVSGTFAVGNVLRNAAGTVRGTIFQVNPTLLRVKMITTSGSFSGTLTDETSGATATWVSNSTQQNLFFTPSGVRGQANPPHPDGLQIQGFRPQELTLTGVTGTFVVGETVNATVPNRAMIISSVTQGGGNAVITGPDGSTNQWVKSANSLVTGATSGATGTLSSARHVNNDFNGLMYCCIFRNIDGQILFMENGNSGMAIVNVLGILSDNSSSSFLSSFSSFYDLDLWHVTLANQPWRNGKPLNSTGLDSNPAKTEYGIGSSFRYNSVSYVSSDFYISTGGTSDDAGMPGFDIYKVHVSTNSLTSVQIVGLASGNPLWTNGVLYTESYDPNKMDYRPASGSPLKNLIASGERLVKYDLVGRLRANDGTGASGAYEAA